jgi:hypothetical protein
MNLTEDAMGTEQKNMELMQTLDDAWNALDVETRLSFLKQIGLGH